MRGKSYMRKKVAALILFIGALPFLFSRAHAQESKWLDDYKQHIGFTYSAKATLNANYIWRGLYAGGLCLQPTASVGYGGFYIDTWWNIGAKDWTFSAFLPEADFSVGFARWGLNIYLLYVHNFNCGFFDFANYTDKGNRLELDVRYTVSSKLPLSFLWASRLSAADGYIGAAGDTLRAWSSYMELSYTQSFPYGLSLYGAVGMTPWRSCYTAYKGNFAVTNIDIRLRKEWILTERCGMMLQGQVTLHPYMLAADRASAQWHPSYPWDQSINANIGLAVYLR